MHIINTNPYVHITNYGVYKYTYVTEREWFLKQSNMSVKAVVLVNSLPPISVISPGLPCTSTTLSSLNEMNLIFVHVIIRFL